MRNEVKWGVGVKNPKLLKTLKKKPCFICGSFPVDIDHIRTRGAGGGDLPNNLLPLCREHHVERHMIGINTFVNRYHLPVDISGIYPKLQFEWRI